MNDQDRPKRGPAETMEDYLKRITPPSANQPDKLVPEDLAEAVVDALDHYLSLYNGKAPFALVMEAREALVEGLILIMKAKVIRMTTIE